MPKNLNSWNDLLIYLGIKKPPTQPPVEPVIPAEVPAPPVEVQTPPDIVVDTEQGATYTATQVSNIFLPYTPLIEQFKVSSSKLKVKNKQETSNKKQATSSDTPPWDLLAEYSASLDTRDLRKAILTDFLYNARTSYETRESLNSGSVTTSAYLKYWKPGSSITTYGNTTGATSLFGFTFWAIFASFQSVLGTEETQVIKPEEFGVTSVGINDKWFLLVGEKEYVSYLHDHEGFAGLEVLGKVIDRLDKDPNNEFLQELALELLSEEKVIDALLYGPSFDVAWKGKIQFPSWWKKAFERWKQIDKELAKKSKLYRYAKATGITIEWLLNPSPPYCYWFRSAFIWYYCLIPSKRKEMYFESYSDCVLANTTETKSGKKINIK
ncbi:MAG: hypothetical protein M1365_04740 [Actinobacteria bacterium]|nr:hypothetical protein [Actinomycetota bacterium]